MRIFRLDFAAARQSQAIGFVRFARDFVPELVGQLFASAALETGADLFAHFRMLRLIMFSLRPKGSSYDRVRIGVAAAIDPSLDFRNGLGLRSMLMRTSSLAVE